jgi:hypothetical protein
VAASLQKQLLIDARALLAERNRWTKGVFARTAQGHAIAWDDPAARRWCAVGALRRAALDVVHDRELAERIADDVEKTACHGRWLRSLVVLNDFSSHKRVLALLDQAIERS